MTAARQKTLEQKLAEWDRAYAYVIEATAHAAYRNDYVQIQKHSATAAIVAAMLVGQNVRPLVMEEGEG